MLEQRIQQQFFDSADLKYQAAEARTRPSPDAVQAVLGCFTPTSPRLTLAALAAGSGLPKSTVHRLCGSLVESRLLEQFTELALQRRWYLGHLHGAPPRVYARWEG